MIELLNDALCFRFPEVHPDAECEIDFQRTLRIPDDNNEYPLPPGLGRFPIKHVDDYAERLPDSWSRHGGVFIPMYQSEALWINFSGRYPCAIKIAAGTIDAVSGQPWAQALNADPQDYVVVPGQPWLDGFNVSEGHVRQFVAMELGEGYTVEEQLTGHAKHGGLQIAVYPMKREFYESYFGHSRKVIMKESMVQALSIPEMGLAPGGLMRQKIYEDRYGLEAWDPDHGARCFVHMANSAVYKAITGQLPPHRPPKAQDYTDAGLPWFDYYDDLAALPGSSTLSPLGSVAAKSITKGLPPMPYNIPIKPRIVRELGRKRQIRVGDF